MLGVEEALMERYIYTFEYSEVANIYQHPHGRTIASTDDVWFTLLDHHKKPIHSGGNHQICQEETVITDFKRPFMVYRRGYVPRTTQACLKVTDD